MIGRNAALGWVGERGTKRRVTQRRKAAKKIAFGDVEDRSSTGLSSDWMAVAAETAVAEMRVTQRRKVRRRTTTSGG